MDDTIKTPDDVEKFLGVSVLGSIPYSENDLSDKAEMERYEKKKKQRKKKQKQKEEKVFGKDEPMSEAARLVRTPKPLLFIR